MTMDSIRVTTIAIAFLMASMPALQVSAAGQEERCNELINDNDPSTSCVCSEPLDWNGGTLNSGLNDPADTSGAYECNPNEGPGDGGGAVNVLNGGTYRTQLASVRGGLPGPTYVLNRVSGSGQLRNKSMQDFTNGTYCMRVYRREDNDAINPIVFGDDNYKGLNMDKDNDGANESPQVQLHWSNRSPASDQGTASCSWIDKRSGYLANTLNLPKISGPGITMNDCSDKGWCRWEICVDHNLSGGNRANVRCRITRLSDGAEDIWEDTSTNGQSRINTGGRTFPARFYVGFNGSGHNTNGWEMHASHSMAAKKTPSDRNFWIGGATEIEGPNAASPPSPARPAAPTLLE
jgi:hypothetical protein